MRFFKKKTATKDEEPGEGSPLKTFDLPMKLPAGHDAPSGDRARLELRAFEKLERQVAEKGYQVLTSTFRVVWEDPRNGTASVDAVRKEGP